MKREDAVARLGHHYVIDDRSGFTVLEKLGTAPKDNALCFDVEEDVLEARSAMTIERADVNLGVLSARLEDPFYRIGIVLARLGLRRDAGDILAAHAARLAGQEAAQKILDLDDTGSQPPVTALPEEIRLPAVLEVGQTLYRLNINPLRRLRIEEVRIAGRNLQGPRDGYDYSFLYTIERDRAPPVTFHYSRDAGDDQTVCMDAENCFYFLTQEAADAAALRTIGLMTANFNALASEIEQRRMARPAPIKGPECTMHSGRS